jgi:hypothetical protein
VTERHRHYTHNKKDKEMANNVNTNLDPAITIKKPNTIDPSTIAKSTTVNTKLDPELNAKKSVVIAPRIINRNNPVATTYVAPANNISINQVIESVVKNYIDTYGGTLNNADHANIADFANAVNYNSVIGKPTFAQVAITGDYNNLSNVPSIANYATFSYVDSAVSNLINSAPAALNTLYELANAIANDSSFSTTVSSALGNRLRVDIATQNLTTTQKTNARTNLGLATVANTGSYTDLTNKPALFSGSYTDLTNKPTIPTDIANLTDNTSLLGQGGGTGNWGFRNDTIYNYAGGQINNSDTTHGATSGLVLPDNGNPGAVTTLFNNYGNVVLTSGEIVTTDNTIGGNGSEFYTDIDIGGGTIIDGWHQRNPQQIEINIFAAPAPIWSILISAGLGATVIVTYSTPSGNQTFTSVLSQQFTGQGQYDPNHDHGQRYSGRIDGTLPAAQTGIVTINFPTSSVTNKNWVFGQDGGLSLPGGAVLTSASNKLVVNDNFSIGAYSSETRLQPSHADANVEIATLATGSMDPSIWKFGTNGNITLPTNTSKINYANGVSILDGISGGASTGNITFDGDNIGSTNDIINIIGNNYAELQSHDNYIWVEETYAAIAVNDYEWTFHDDAVLTIANGANISQTTDNGGQKTFNITPPDTSDFEVVTVDGNIRLQTANSYGVGTTSTWTFGTDGNLTIPGSVIGNGNLKLQPDSASSLAYLDVYLTVGPDIHIAGNGENLILGRDNGANLMIGNDGNVTIRAEDGVSVNWVFNANSNLTVPGDILAQEGNDLNFEVYDTISGGTTLTLVNRNAISGQKTTQFVIGSETVELTTNFNHPTGTRNKWIFEQDGNLTLPAGGTINDSTGKSIVKAEPSFVVKNSNFNCESGYRYGIDTSNGILTATLPSDPSIGDAIYFMDFGYIFSTNNLIVARNTSQLIMNQTNDLTVSTDGQSFGLVWTGTTWRIY